MPLPALAVFRFVFSLQVALFAQSVGEVPQLNPAVGPNSGSAAGSLTSGSNAPLVWPQAGNLSLAGSVLPAVRVAPVEAPAAGVQASPQAAAQPKEQRAAATVKEQLESVSKQAGEVSKMLEQPGGDKSAEQGSAKVSALFEGSQAKAAPVEAPPGPLNVLAEKLSLLERASDNAKDPTAYKSLANSVVSALKAPSELSLKSKAAYQRGDPALIAGLQTALKTALLSKAREVARGRGLEEKAVITHGTSLQGLLGMIFSDGIDATSSYQGFSGESAAFWGARGLDVGASYGATRGVAKGQPGVSVIIFNPQDPVKIVQGETMSRRPTVSNDFFAAIVSDGGHTVVIDQAALRMLAASAEAWKKAAVDQARQGRMKEFNEWEKLRSVLEPGGR